MKKIGFGIAILLFAILLGTSMNGLLFVSWGIGTIGLILTIIGYVEKERDNK